MIIIDGSTSLTTSIICSILAMQVAGHRQSLNSHLWSVLLIGYMLNSFVKRFRKQKIEIQWIKVKRQALAMVVQLITSHLQCRTLDNTWFGESNAIKLLVSAGTDVMTQDWNGRSALHLAVVLCCDHVLWEGGGLRLPCSVQEPWDS